MEEGEKLEEEEAAKSTEKRVRLTERSIKDMERESSQVFQIFLKSWELTRNNQRNGSHIRIGCGASKRWSEESARISISLKSN